jgi:hypothetical protein
VVRRATTVLRGYNYSKDAHFKENETEVKEEMRNACKDLVNKL